MYVAMADLCHLAQEGFVGEHGFKQSSCSALRSQLVLAKVPYNKIRDRTKKLVRMGGGSVMHTFAQTQVLGNKNDLVSHAVDQPYRTSYCHVGVLIVLAPGHVEFDGLAINGKLNTN